MFFRKKIERHQTYNKLFIALLFGVVAVFLTAAFGYTKFSILVGWDVFALVYVILVWSKIWKMDPKSTRSHVIMEDPGRAIADLILILASVASLFAVVFLMSQATHNSGIDRITDVILGLISVIVSWVLVHTTYTLKYARVYYNEPGGEVEFNEKALPQYTDFAYLSFTLGMTFQVSDTNLKTKEIRVMALFHAILSFLFSVVIIATTINLMSSLY